MALTACAWCGVEAFVKNWRFKGHGKHCCDRKCSAKFRIARGLGTPSVDQGVIEHIQFEYEQRSSTIEEIAVKFGYSKSRIFQLAKKNGWIKHQRTVAVRTIYRKMASIKVGRELIRGEHVHHIDGVITNNVLDNLHVFSNAKKHTQCHGSLERAAFELYRRGLIRFDPNKGEYFLA